MKKFLTTITCILASVSIASADFLGDLSGKWLNLNVPEGTRITSVFKRTGKKAFTRTSTVTTTFAAPSIGVFKYKSNGTVTGTFKRSGVIEATSSGTWRISANKLIENVTISSPVTGELTQKTTITFTNRNKLKAVSLSNGERNTGALKRVK